MEFAHTLGLSTVKYNLKKAIDLSILIESNRAKEFAFSHAGIECIDKINKGKNQRNGPYNRALIDQYDQIPKIGKTGKVAIIGLCSSLAISVHSR